MDGSDFEAPQVSEKNVLFRRLIEERIKTSSHGLEFFGSGIISAVEGGKVDSYLKLMKIDRSSTEGSIVESLERIYLLLDDKEGNKDAIENEIKVLNILS